MSVFTAPALRRGEGNLNKKIIAFSCIAWASAAISSARPAKAYVLIPLQNVTQVAVTPRFRSVEPINACGMTFIYQQLMAIPGVGNVWLYTDFRYPNTMNGHQDTIPYRTCENGEGFVYMLGDCGC